MNITTIAMCLMAYKLLTSTQSKPMSKPNMGIDSSMLDGILSDDAKSIVNNINTLTSSSQDKTGALLSIVTNPAVMGVLSSMFGDLLGNLANNGSQSTASSSQPSATEDNLDTSVTDDTIQHSSSDNIDDDKYNGQYYRGSSVAQHFFSPVSDIAGQEVSSKLYQVYDNWYGRNSNT